MVRPQWQSRDSTEASSHEPRYFEIDTRRCYPYAVPKGFNSLELRCAPSDAFANMNCISHPPILPLIRHNAPPQNCCSNESKPVTAVKIAFNVAFSISSAPVRIELRRNASLVTDKSIFSVAFEARIWLYVGLCCDAGGIDSVTVPAVATHRSLPTQMN
jgi:hypothetical protein